MNREFTVSHASAGRRLDVFIADELEILSRRRARLLCEAGAVLVNGRSAKSGRHLEEGDVVIVTEEPESPQARPELVGEGQVLPVLFEDEHLLAVVKPAGMPTVTLSSDDPLTVADCIAGYCPACLASSRDAREAGLVQRLDFWTSGIILAAKTRTIWDTLHEAIIKGRIRKHYLALVEGNVPWDETQVVLPLYAKSPARMAVWTNREEAPPTIKLLSADSHLKKELTDRDGNWSVVRAIGGGMRRHQVRAHLTAKAHPLWGDETYGSKRKLNELGIEREGFLLHAQALHFSHPVTKRGLQITTDSKELELLLEQNPQRQG